MKKYALFVALIIILGLGIAIDQRHRILFPLMATGEPVPPLKEGAVIEGGIAFGNYFVVVMLDEKTFAIAEPHSQLYNFNYLILGNDRALLFDAGIGHYDIRSVVDVLTNLPVTFMPSHFHYDHTGQGTWENLAIIDLPHIREQAEGDTLTLTWGQYLGALEGLETPVWNVTEWIKPGSIIDLGGRQLQLLYTPGHTDNSVSLYDMERETMFTGDFLTSTGFIFAITPTASMGDYTQTTEKILRVSADMPQTVFRGAHSNADGVIPAKSRDDLELLLDTLKQIKDGKLTSSGGFPAVYIMQDGTAFQAEPAWLQDWSVSYPDTHIVHDGVFAK